MTDKTSVTIQIDNLIPGQDKAILALLYQWETLGNIGSSGDTNFYADGDGSFRPKIKVIQGREIDNSIINGGSWDKSNGYATWSIDCDEFVGEKGVETSILNTGVDDKQNSNTEEKECIPDVHSKFKKGAIVLGLIRNHDIVGREVTYEYRWVGRISDNQNSNDPAYVYIDRFNTHNPEEVSDSLRPAKEFPDLISLLIESDEWIRINDDLWVWNMY